MLNIVWNNCVGNVWCDFNILDLSDRYFDNKEGVYVIWRPSDTLVIRVGQGNIRDRIQDHRNNPDIVEYCQNTKAVVSWASVDERYRNGVERYLAEVLKPVVGNAFPDTEPIEVNLPAPLETSKLSTLRPYLGY